MSDKLTPYAKLLTMSKELKDKALAPIRARRERKRGELEVVKLEEKVVTLDAEVTELCSKQELDFDAILRAKDNAALAQRKLDVLTKVMGELFPGK